MNSRKRIEYTKAKKIMEQKKYKLLHEALYYNFYSVDTIEHTEKGNPELMSSYVGSCRKNG